MKLRTLVVLCGLISTAAWAGDLVITSFPGNGTLTWTNSVSSEIGRRHDKRSCAAARSADIAARCPYHVK